MPMSLPMLPVSSLAPARLKGLAQRQLFWALGDTGEKFLAGQINTTPVLVMIAGEAPFKVAQPKDWSRAAGVLIKEIRFEVDLASGEVVSSNTTPAAGRLIVGREGLFLVGRDRVGSYEVCLGGGEDIEPRDGDVAFSSWRIVVGTSDQPIELFSSVPRNVG